MGDKIIIPKAVNHQDQIYCPLRTGAVSINHPVKGQALIISSAVCLLSEGFQCAFSKDGKCMIRQFFSETIGEIEESNKESNK